MQTDVGDLYPLYLRAVEFFNTRIEQRYDCERTRAVLRLRVLSEAEFPAWWASVNEDKELQSRWLARLEDPEGSLDRACRRISATLNRISNRRGAA